MSFLENLVVLLIRNTFLGRGFFRKYSINFLKSQFLEKRVSPVSPLPSLVVKINKTPFKFYFDELSNLSKFVGKDDKDEVNFLKSELKDNFVFIDIGANNGFYSQMILAEITAQKKGSIIAIEPNPLMCERIKENIHLLDSADLKVSSYVQIVNCAVGEVEKDAFLNFSSGYGQAHIDADYNKGIPVKIRTLIDILTSQNISKIDALKIDVEGYEVAALKPFFNIAPIKLLPKKIVIEYTHKDGWGEEDFINTLKSKYAYNITNRTRGNLLLKRG